MKAAGREVVTFPSRGYGHDRTMRLISAATLYSIYRYLLYHTPEHDRQSGGGHVTDHSSGLDDHSVTDQQSQALDQRASVIKTHRRHPACRLGSVPVAKASNRDDP